MSKMPEFDFHLLQSLGLSGVAVTAQLGPGGTLQPIAGTFAKLLAAAREQSFPRLHTVVVAAAQPLAHFNLTPLSEQQPKLLCDPYADLHIVRAHTLAEAIQLLAVDAQTRWGYIDCTLPSRDPQFAGRTQLMAAVRQFIATQSSGYLIITGGMGQGKSALLTELIHQAVDRGQTPIYHYIDDASSSTAMPHAIAACLYSQLQRKYAFPEPHGWAQLPVADKLERLLKQISQISLPGLGEPEIIYLDAADQAESSPAQPLLPGVLRRLPPGVIGIITSRPQLTWLATSQEVTIWEMAEYVDDRADVRAYLTRQRQQQRLLFSAAFINQVVSQPDPPVFFTVTQQLRRQTAALFPPAEQDSGLRLWVMPPESLIQAEAVRVVARARAVGLEENQVWYTLGLLAVAREGLSPAQLQALQWEQAGEIERVCALATNFFAPRPGLRQPDLPYKFDHPGYHQAVLIRLSSIEQADCHHRLAMGCSQWRTLSGKAYHYALRHGPYHGLTAGQWHEFEAMLGDIQFLEARCAANLVFEIAADLAAGLRQGCPLDRVTAALASLVNKRLDEQIWLPLRNALMHVFGSYADWPEALRSQLELSEQFNVLCFLAEIHDMEGRFGAAASLFAMMREMVTLTDPTAYAVASVRLANVLEHQQEYSQAWHILETLTNQPGAQNLYKLHYEWMRYHQGVMLHRLGQYGQAQQVLEQVHDSTTEQGLRLATWHHLGIIDLERGQLAKAEERFGQCLVERGENTWNHRRAFEYRRLGQVYALQGLWSSSQDAFQEAVAISRKCGNLRYIHKTQKDIARFLIAPVLQQEHPAMVSKSELVQRFGLEEPTYLSEAFRILFENHAGYVDVIDADTGQPTDQAAHWDVAHQKGLWHRSVSIVVTDSQGSVAWQQRGEADSHGKWDISVSGHCPAGEDDMTTAIRETEEELGLRIRVDRLIRIGQPNQFRKVGNPTCREDRHEGAGLYQYQTDKLNNEYVSLFVVGITEAEKEKIFPGGEHGALTVKWVSLPETIHAAVAQPAKFASAFKQVFGHETVSNHICQVIQAQHGKE